MKRSPRPLPFRNRRAFCRARRNCAPVCVPSGILSLVRLAPAWAPRFPRQRGLRDADRDGAVQVVFAALEEGVRLHLQEHVEIARRPAIDARLAFIRKPQASAVVHSGGDVDLELPLHLAVAVAAALAARVPDDLPRSPASAARAPDRKKALLVQNLPAAVHVGQAAGEVPGSIPRRGTGRRSSIRASGFRRSCRIRLLQNQVPDRSGCPPRVCARLRRRPPPKRSPKPKKSPRMSLKSAKTSGL